MTTALTLPQRAAVALGDNANAAKLKLLVAASANILTVTNLDGRTEAHRAGMTLRNARTAITSTGKTAREDATAFSKAVIAMEKDLIAIIEPEEVRVLGLRDGFDAAEQLRKDALIAAERARTDFIKGRIEAISSLPLSAVGKSSADISAMIGRLASASIDESFEEFVAEAKQCRLDALDQLAALETKQRNIEIEAEAQRQQLAREKAEREEEAERLAAERLALEQELAAMAERAAEQDRIAKAERDAAQAELKAQQDKANAEMAERQRQMDAQAAELQRKLDEADTRDAAQAKAAKDAQDAIDAEALRVKRQAEADQHLLDVALLDLKPSFPWPDKAAPIRPSDTDLASVIANYFAVDIDTAAEWLSEFDGIPA